MNYDDLMRDRLESIRKQGDGAGKKLLLHACCAPCSSACLELLREYLDVTVFYYNPNITDKDEYICRKKEVERLVREYNAQVDAGSFPGMRSTENARRVSILEAPYDPETFFSDSAGLESCREGGERCGKCFFRRLSVTAEYAAKNGFDLFTTTLTISPLKNAELINRTGEEAGERYGVCFLPSDFKKKNGYKRSVELSEMFSLYRQNYCGCVFSKADRI